MNLNIKSTLVKNAAKYAAYLHEAVNHYYSGQPYSVHLEMVYNYAYQFRYLLDPSNRETALAAAFCHDLIEDTRETYNDVKSATNEAIAEVVYALTNEKGKNRKERANEKYYQGIRENEIAVFVKICDRLANVKFSKDTESKMFAVYKKEHWDFKNILYTIEFKDMWIELDNLINN